MKKQNEGIKDWKIIICRNCRKKVARPGLVGLTLVCPYCAIPVNGQYHPLA